MNRLPLISLTAASLFLGACSTSGSDASSTTQALIEEPAPVVSMDPRVKYKDGDRYLSDLADSLSLPRETICQELGQYDCFEDAFRIVLGGVEAENLLVHEPLEVEALTAPIAYDRLALNVCAGRVGLDVADPDSAVLYKPAGKKRPDAAWLEATAGTLYGAVLRRDPTPGETARLVGFYDEIAANTPSGGDAPRDWTTLSCFAVASSLEAIFY